MPQARITFNGRPSTAALASLFAAITITGWAGHTKNIDPGRPGVPEFGRKLYGLRLPQRRSVLGISRLKPTVAAAIARKTAIAYGRLPTPHQLGFWHNAFMSFLAQLRDARFAGIVLDYDGTLADPRRRFEPIDPAIASELARIAKAGICVGIATGRGASVRRDLQERLPSALWHLFHVGYYNGAEIALLDDNDAPDGTKRAHRVLRPLASKLRNHTNLSDYVSQEDRPLQITLEAKGNMSGTRLWEIAHQATLTSGILGVSVTRSGHSVDILAPGVSKLSVVHHLRETTGHHPVLVVGDRGRWPGNDHELLNEPFALGVDEISADPATGWHLGKPGQRGPRVTLDYLTAMRVRGGRFTFDSEAFI